MKNRPVEAEVFHDDGQTDMTMLTVTFRNFVNAPPKRKTLDAVHRMYLHKARNCAQHQAVRLHIEPDATVIK
jgi:hypothetical protein